MSLGCEVVRDLYVLYKSGDLSDSTRKNIDEHISGCEICRTIYEQEDGFEKIFKEEKKIVASEALDEKLLLRLRLKRLRIGVIIAFLILALVASSACAISSYDRYKRGRQIMARDIGMGVLKVHNLNYYVNYVKEDKLEELLQETQVDIIKFQGYINKKESLEAAAKRQGTSKFNYLKDHPMNIDSLEHVLWDINYVTRSSVEDNMNKRERESNFADGLGSPVVYIDFLLVDVLSDLQKKYRSGKWRNEDENAFRTIKKYIFNYYVILAEQSRKLNEVTNGGAYEQVDADFNLKRYSVGKIVNAFTNPVDVDVKAVCKANKELNDYINDYCKRNNISRKK